MECKIIVLAIIMIITVPTILSNLQHELSVSSAQSAFRVWGKSHGFGMKHMHLEWIPRVWGEFAGFGINPPGFRVNSPVSVTPGRGKRSLAPPLPPSRPMGAGRGPPVMAAPALRPWASRVRRSCRGRARTAAAMGTVHARVSAGALGVSRGGTRQGWDPEAAPGPPEGRRAPCSPPRPSGRARCGRGRERGWGCDRGPCPASAAPRLRARWSWHSRAGAERRGRSLCQCSEAPSLPSFILGVL